MARDAVHVVAQSLFSLRECDATGSRGGGSPDYLIKTCEESLQRLGIETLDVFCMSRVDPAVPIEESVAGMARVVRTAPAALVSRGDGGAHARHRARDRVGALSAPTAAACLRCDRGGLATGHPDHGY